MASGESAARVPRLRPWWISRFNLRALLKLIFPSPITWRGYLRSGTKFKEQYGLSRCARRVLGVAGAGQLDFGEALGRLIGTRQPRQSEMCPNGNGFFGLG